MGVDLRAVVNERTWCITPRVYWVNVAVIACVIGVFASGLPCVYPLFTGFLKSFFNFTQTEGGCYAVGVGLHIPAAVLDSHVGPRWTVSVGAVITCTGFILFYLSIVLEEIRHSSFVFKGVFFFLTGIGRTFTYISSFTTAMFNSPSEHRAKVTAMLDMVFEGGTFLQILVFYNIFKVQYSEDKDPVEEVINFTLFTMVIISVFHVLFGPFVIRYKNREPDTNEDGDSKPDRCSAESDWESPAVLQTVTVRRLQRLNKASSVTFLLNSEFLLLNFSTSLSIGVCYCFLFNASPLSKSLETENFSQTFFVLFYVGLVTVRMAAGIVLDRLRRNGKIYGLTICVFLLAAAGQTSVLISPEVPGVGRVTLLAIGFVSEGMVVGAMYVIAPVLLSDVFGMAHFGRNVAVIYSSSTILSVVVQIIYGCMYDAIRVSLLTDGHNITQAKQPPVHLNVTISENEWTTNQTFLLNSLDCIGRECVTPILLVMLVLSVVSLSMFVVLFVRLHDKLCVKIPSTINLEPINTQLHTGCP